MQFIVYIYVLGVLLFFFACISINVFDNTSFVALSMSPDILPQTSCWFKVTSRQSLGNRARQSRKALKTEEAKGMLGTEVP